MTDGGTAAGETTPAKLAAQGFIVMNFATYPTLVRLFDELGVQTQPTEMSMSVSCDGRCTWYRSM